MSGDYVLKTMNKAHNFLMKSFSCVEDDSIFSDLNSKARRKIRTRSGEIDKFFKEEAFQEQLDKMNTTHVLLNKKQNVILGIMSLCADSIPLTKQEKADNSCVYENAPAIKIARLTVNKKFQGKGLGKILIDYAVFLATKIRKNAGVKFITVDCYKHRMPFYEKFMFVKNDCQKFEDEWLLKSMIMNIDKYLASL
jgi:predicted GNAT family N-acyltransferase